MTALLERVAALRPEQRSLLATRLRRRVAERAAPAIPVRPAGAPVLLSELQEGLWFLEQLDPGSPRFCLPGTLRIGGPLDAGLIERAFNLIVARHEALRTTFPAHDGTPKAEVAAQLTLTLERADVSARPPDEREAAAAQLALAAALAPFDLATGPLVRVGLVRLAPDDHLLLVNLHHIVADGWSLELLVRELAAAYGALREGATPALPALRVQYGDFAWWQRRGPTAEQQAEQLAYWRGQLAGAPPWTELPTDRPRPARPSYWSGHASVTLSPETTAALRELGRGEGATLFMTLLAGFQALLHRLSGQDDVIVGSPIAGRRFSELEPLVGLFVNMLALRARFEGAPSFRQALRRVRAGVLGAYAHQDVPFARVVAALQVPRRLDRAPLFQAVFILLDHAPGLGPEGAAPAGLQFGALEIDKQTVKYDLILFAQQRAQGLSLELLYATALYDASTAEQMLGLYAALLEQALARPDDSLLALELGAAPRAPAAAPDEDETEFRF